MNEPTKFAIKTAERKNVIVEAAAELIITDGISALTHRKVAAVAHVPLGSTTQHFASLDDLKNQALSYLGAQMDEYLRQGTELLAQSEDVAAGLADFLYEYLSDPTSLSTGAAFYVACTERPELRPLTVRVFDGMTEIMENYMSKEAARAIGILTDGAMFYTITHEAPPDKQSLQTTITKLMEL